LHSPLPEHTVGVAAVTGDWPRGHAAIAQLSVENPPKHSHTAVNGAALGSALHTHSPWFEQ
jgi:hypothetical protein